MTFAEQLLDALGDVGMDLIDMSEKQQFRGSLWRRALPVAACAALLLTGGILAQRHLTAQMPAPAAAASGEAVACSLVPETVLLSSQSSDCAGDPVRQKNLALACEAIDGMVLEPGEVFSFNAAVGERTAEKGYAAVSTYSDGAGTSEIGGGIGQVASMLYCASLKLDLDQLERAGNTYAVSYVAKGFDAAVYWDVTDYCFANSLATPVEIRAEVSGDQVTVALWGQPEEARRIELESVLHAENVVETYQVFLDADGSVLRKDSIDITRYEPRQ